MKFSKFSLTLEKSNKREKYYEKFEITKNTIHYKWIGNHRTALLPFGLDCRIYDEIFKICLSVGFTG